MQVWIWKVVLSYFSKHFAQLHVNSAQNGAAGLGDVGQVLVTGVREVGELQEGPETPFG